MIYGDGRLTNSDCTELKRVIKAGSWLYAAIGKDQIVRIVDTYGKQAVDFLCLSFSGDDVDFYNSANTIKINGRAYIERGSILYSEHAVPLMDVIEDSCGEHDTIAGCCSEEMNKLRYNLDKSPSCRENFINALRAIGIKTHTVPSNINFFMNVPLCANRVEIAESKSKPGDYVALKALTDVHIIISNCPQMNNPASGYNPTDIELSVSRPSQLPRS